MQSRVERNQELYNTLEKEKLLFKQCIDDIICMESIKTMGSIGGVEYLKKGKIKDLCENKVDTLLEILGVNL